MLKTSSINTITQLSCPTPPSLSYTLTLFSFQLFWSPNCPMNALSLIPISFYPSTMLLFLTPPGTSPVSYSPLTFKNLYPLPTTNPYLSQNLAVPTPPPVLLLQLISLGTSSHPCHVWLLITLSPLLPTTTPALPLLASHFQLLHQHPSPHYHPLQSFPLQTLALTPNPRIPIPSLGLPNPIPCPAFLISNLILPPSYLLGWLFLIPPLPAF